jgi:uncharacterized protein YbaA (DUF1428 family)
MTYVEGFVLAVPSANKDRFREHAEGLKPLFRECGIVRQVENWGDDVPEGKVTDFRKAVNAEDGEQVVFAWFEYPSRQARDAANEMMRTDPRMAPTDDIPFDGKRMIMGCFESIVEETGDGAAGYADGFVLPVPNAKKEDYRAMAAKAASLFREFGAVRVVENWGDDVPDGQVTDFRRAVKAEEGENVVFSWVEWPSKQARDEAWPKLMADNRMKPDFANMPFDGKRMFWGGFDMLVDSGRN